MNIIQRPTTNFWSNANKPKWVIVHGTAGGSSALGVAQDFINSQGTVNPKSTHYVIGRDGQIVQCVRENDAAWGNGVLEPGHDPWWTINPNLQTISIEHVKPDTQNASALTDAQKIASFTLIRDICDRWGIPKRKADKYGGITGHFSISPVDRAHCPGTYPWNELFTFLGDDMLQLTDPFAAAYFTQVAGDRWHCNNGNDVLGAILTLYRKSGGVLGIPQTQEQYNIPGVVWQRFTGGIVVYDPESKLVKYGGPFHPCYTLDLNSDLAKAILGITALQNQLAKAGDGLQLQAQLDAAQKALADEQAKESKLNEQITALQAQVNELTSQLSQRPDKATIASDIASAIQAALSKL